VFQAIIEFGDSPLNYSQEQAYKEAADRWYPLIYRGALEYEIPGKFDHEDLVQEGLALLYEQWMKFCVEGVGDVLWSLDSIDFEKYFKTALFHRYVDKYRQQRTKKRDFTKEVHASCDYDPLENLVASPFDSPDQELLKEDFHREVRERLTDLQQLVFDCLVSPPESLLKSLREVTCRGTITYVLDIGAETGEIVEVFECGYSGEPVGGKCPKCSGDLTSTRSPSRVLQSEVQKHLGLKRTQVSESIYAIRRIVKDLDTPSSQSAHLDSFLELFGYGKIQNDEGEVEYKPWPLVASCRYEEGSPSFYNLSYLSLRSVLSSPEIQFLDFMVSHPSTEYYRSIRFTDMARRLQMTVHRLRSITDSIRIKMGLIESGVPLRDIPKEL
jgi:DNA-directed RNA polymerase specialized sigma24 family protein